MTIALALNFSAGACGPFFPNNMLGEGDESVLAAPRTEFYGEVDRIRLPRATFRARNAPDFAAEAEEADALELRDALRKKHLPEATQKKILEDYGRERAKLTNLRVRLENWRPNGEGEWTNGVFAQTAPKPRPMLDNLNVSALAGAPGEFADYLQGSLEWFNGSTNEARAHWEALLNRPPEERHYRSTWAAHMLGKSWMNDDPEKAAAYFQQVRALKLAQFGDRLALAAASLGEEGRIRLRQKKLEAAMALYISQLATGDGSASGSLLFVCRDALGGTEEELATLAANRQSRRVMTAFVTSQGNLLFYSDDPSADNRLRWLQAVESAQVKDVESAEQLALAAYQAGKWDMARRWLARATETPTAQWLQAKLLLRDGKIEQAARLLQRIAGLFPTQPRDPDSKITGMQDNLQMPGFTYLTDYVSAHDQIQAETGVLHLARREYAQSLDALLRAGFWCDAAYIAERVLTPAELKRYVDQNWPIEAANSQTNNAETHANFGRDIRYLLGRRLAREGKWDVARHYYPASQLTNYDAMVQSLTVAYNAELPAPSRATAFTEAAWIFRSLGMELLGTEVEPDCHIVDGAFSEAAGTFDRQPGHALIVSASADELKRAKAAIEPSRRFHYRWQAAQLAWEASKLMPDNTDEKARLLCIAGSWLKVLDPKAADVFYKTLVRHCRKTAIGALADRKRWFPILDESGNLVPGQGAPSPDGTGSR